MSTTSNTQSKGVKWFCLLIGIMLVLAALGWLGWNGYLAWLVWKAQHVKGKPVPPQALSNLIAAYAGKLMGGIIGLFAGIWLLQFGNKKTGSSLVAEATAVQNLQSHTALPELAVKPQHRAKARRWTSCNVLAVGADVRRLWTFNSGKNGFMVAQQAAIPSAQPLPARTVGRDWRNLPLLQPKLNIAWLPIEQVFLRVAHLPVSNFDETLSMVELQLEKLSPLPVTQIVWSVQILPQIVDNLQTVIVIIVARDLVEKFLGQLEGQGFLADRLELPIVDELLATRITHDGAYIYPDNSTGKYSALVAWWYGGTLRNLGLLHVPAADNRADILKDQLAQMTWAGELEGWLSGTPRWSLIANDATAANWQPMFRPWLGQNVEVLPPLSEADLATRNANRAARAESSTGILPVEYALRYAQEFHDRLWMRGLGTIVVVYLIGVMVYMAGASWKGMQADNLEMRMKGLAREYTNTLQVKAQVEILQNRQALKFASLDCWKTTAELLPAGITLGSMDFKEGKTLSLSGTAPGDANGTLTDFNEAMRKFTRPDGQLMFERVDLPSVRLNAGGGTLSWGFSATLANAEETQ
ncbi:MAG TPA: hypothetical protein VG754_07605 [Verrucomicrobiae bacterium]|nr:hypothetical protein [Verrucomicrobiae bacterium]